MQVLQGWEFLYFQREDSVVLSSVAEMAPNQTDTCLNDGGSHV